MENSNGIKQTILLLRAVIETFSNHFVATPNKANANSEPNILFDRYWILNTVLRLNPQHKLEASIIRTHTDINQQWYINAKKKWKIKRQQQRK